MTRPGPIDALGAALRKDLLLFWRGRAQLTSVFVFGASALLLFSFAIGPDAGALRLHASGFLWLALLLSSTLSLQESFRAEYDQGALEGLLLLPTDAAVLYFAKALSNWFQLALVGVALLPVMVVLYDIGGTGLGSLLLIIVLGTGGLSAPGTLYAAMAGQLRGQQVLLPLLLFPLVTPVLLAAGKASSLVLLGDPMDQVGAWVALLAVFNLLFWPLCGLLFGRVVEE